MRGPILLAVPELRLVVGSGAPLGWRRQYSSRSPIARLPEAAKGIAGLVALGQTNREVAVSLSLSVRTVESHLGRIYRKLGLRSRTELATRLRA